MASVGKLAGGEQQDILDPGNVLAYLSGRGLQPPAGTEAKPLGGGVSNIVIAVGDGAGAIVVKQALARLRVADAWWAPRDRALAEADALDLVGRLTPGAVPRVIDRDPGRCALVIERAPAGWRDWKSLLLSGRADEKVARRLGFLLARWHSATTVGAAVGATTARATASGATTAGAIAAGATPVGATTAGATAAGATAAGATAAAPGLSHRFYAQEPFEALRVEPYYRTVARRLPHMADAVLGYADTMLGRRLCLVHGDFSPKNVLVGEGPEGRDAPGLWVIDFEVAHLGDPAFDLAFMLCHLMLKAVHRPGSAPGYDRCALEFVTAYGAGVSAEVAPSWEYVLGHVGCLLLARVDGKSPAEYLSEDERQIARKLGEHLALTPPVRPEDLPVTRRQAGQ